MMENNILHLVFARIKAILPHEILHSRLRSRLNKIIFSDVGTTTSIKRRNLLNVIGYIKIRRGTK